MGTFATPTHLPVLVPQCLELLGPAFKSSVERGAHVVDPRAGGDRPVMVDATVGLGGHTEAFLQAFPDLLVIGIDRDLRALAKASERLQPYGDRFIPFHGTYDQIPQALRGAKADGILMDLGVSSMQLDQPERGFSYAVDAPLDMRMNSEDDLTAYEIVQTWSAQDLARIFRRYGEERSAPRVARAIVAARDQQPIETTGQLVEIVREAIPAPAKRKGGHPAKRVFQALRIAVNSELDILEDALPAALSSLRVGGRLAVESYQSLEDRLVKQIFTEGAASGLPPGLPVSARTADSQRRLKLLTRGALKASPSEIERNPRSASVRLRAAELLKPWSDHGV